MFNRPVPVKSAVIGRRIHAVWLAATLAISGHAQAASFIWGGGTLNWTNTSAAGWNGGPPAAGDTATINSGTVSGTANDQTAGVHINLTGATLNSGGTYLTVNANTSLSGGNLVFGRGAAQSGSDILTREENG